MYKRQDQYIHQILEQQQKLLLQMSGGLVLNKNTSLQIRLPEKFWAGKMAHRDHKVIIIAVLVQIMLLEEKFLKFIFKLVLMQVLILLEQMLRLLLVNGSINVSVKE